MRVIRGVAAVGPMLFLAIAIAEGFVRGGYDPVAQPISALALGDRGWIQTINFQILTVSLLAMAVVMRRRIGTRLVPAGFVVMALGVALAGVFPMDGAGAPPTRTGEIHMAAGFLVFPLIPIVVLASAVGLRRADRHVSIVAGLLCLATISFFLAFVGPPGFDRPLPHLVGLVQRIELLVFFAWIAIVALHAPVEATPRDLRPSPTVRAGA